MADDYNEDCEELEIENEVEPNDEVVDKLRQLIIDRLSRLYPIEGAEPRILENGVVMSYFPHDDLTAFMSFAHDLCMDFNGANGNISLNSLLIQKIQSGKYVTTDEEIAAIKEYEDIEFDSAIKLNELVNDAVFETIQSLINKEPRYAQVIRNFFLDPTMILGKVGVQQACRTAVDILINKRAEDYKGHSSFTTTNDDENYEKWCAGAAVARMVSRQARQAYKVLKTLNLEIHLLDDDLSDTSAIDIIEARFKALDLGEG